MQSDNTSVAVAGVSGAAIMLITNTLNPLLADLIRPLWVALILSFLASMRGINIDADKPPPAAYGNAVVAYLFASLFLFASATGTQSVQTTIRSEVAGGASAAVSALWPSSAYAYDPELTDEQIVQLCLQGQGDPRECIEAERARRAAKIDAQKQRREEQQKGAFPPRW